MPAAIVVLGAGAGTRVGADVNKMFLSLGSDTVIGTSVATALGVGDVARLLVVAAPGEEAEMLSTLSSSVGALLHEREIAVVTGGATRQESERNALRVLADDIASGAVDVVAIHDGARPFATVELYDAVLAAARARGGAVPTVPAEGLVTRDLSVVSDPLVSVQTPQAFRAPVLLAAYRAAGDTAFTDTAGCVQWFLQAHPAVATDVEIVPVPSTPLNLKITWPEDVTLASRVLQAG